MTPKLRIHAHSRRLLAVTTALCLVLGSTAPALAAEPIGDGVAPTYDEAYYATVDYYGNLTDGSVVKSYILNGANTLTDHGTYDEVVNLTDSTAPTVAGGVTTFRFDGEDAPSHFYFEGKTAAPFETLPWTITIHYTLNGVPTKAEDLAGKTGVVEIFLDIVPNDSASPYAKNNYTLEAMAIFNQDDILSLEAPGAQVQLIGNLRAVLFLALPGEEQHFSIRVGAEDFSFGGMTFLMVPATLSQLEQFAELSDRKDELEEDYHKLSDSLDTLLDAFGDMEGSLYATAKGLDQLNQARSTISAGKGSIYEGVDLLRGDLTGIAALLDPVAEQVQAASQAVTDSKAVLNTMTDTALSLKDQLADLEEDLEDLEDSDDVQRLLEDAAGMESSLNKLKSALNSLKGIQGGSSVNVRETLQQVNAFHDAYEEEDFTAFLADMLYLGGKAATPEEAAATAEMIAPLSQIPQLPEDDENYAVWVSVQQQYALFQAKGAMDFETFCAQVTGDAKLAAQMDYLWELQQGDDAPALDILLDSMDQIMGDVGQTTSDVNDALGKIAGPTATVVGQLADLCGELDGLTDLLDTAGNLSATLRRSSEKLRDILDSTDELRTVLNDYEPKAQETLKTLEDLSVTAAATVRDSEKLVGDTEALMKASGAQLDSGTKQTLEGMAAALRQAAKSLSTTNDVKDAKSSISSIIEDTWNEHTGEVDNLLNMDATAAPESLTSSENPAPTSIQVVIRSQEIKAEEPEETEAEKTAAQTTTFWGRVAQMFRDFWAAITGLFR